MTPTTEPKYKTTTYSKPKKSILEPKDIELSVAYTFSINPNDDYQFWNDIESERIKKATNHMKYIIKHNPNLLLDLYVDVSSLGRIHWHGTVTFKHFNHVKMFYTEFVHDILTKHTLEVDTIKDNGVWVEYCLKCKHLWNVNLKTEIVCKIPIANSKRIFKDITTM